MRIGVPSFVIPDTRDKNVQYIIDNNIADEVELLFMESVGEYDFPERREIEALAEFDVFYNVHLPYDVDLSTAAGWDMIDKFYKELKVLNPHCWTVHPSGDEHLFSEHLTGFVENKEIVLTVENIENDFHYLDLVMKTPAYICCDIGHLVHQGEDVSSFLKKYGEKIKLFHIHGVNGNKDHSSLIYLDKKIINTVFEFAQKKDISVNVEIFGEEKLLESLAHLEGIIG